jgi:hypothetical protein
MLSEEELRKIGWYSQFGAADPAEFQKVIAEHQALIAEVRRLQAANAKLRAACEAWLQAVDSWPARFQGGPIEQTREALDVEPPDW